jgi:hypothetical protein
MCPLSGCPGRSKYSYIMHHCPLVRMHTKKKANREEPREGSQVVE